MTGFEREMFIFALSLPLVVVAVDGVRRLWAMWYTRARAECVARISAMMVASEEPSDGEMRSLRRRFMPSVILESVLFVVENVYGGTLTRLALIVEVCEVDFYLLHHLRKARGAVRTLRLSQLSQLAMVGVVVDRSELIVEGDAEENFFAMLTLVASNPEESIRHITRYKRLMSTYEIALLAQTMHRVGAPMAYTPLMSSRNRNLQLLGVYLVEQYLIVDAESHLQQLAESETAEISYAALHALCTVRGDISAPKIARALARLKPLSRLSLLRHAVYSCYSLSSCAHLFNREECRRFVQMSNSYKCTMVCN